MPLLNQLRIYMISPELLAQFITTGKYPSYVVDGCPPTAEFVSAHYDLRDRLFCVVMRDDSFDVIASGSTIPMGEPPTITIAAGDD